MERVVCYCRVSTEEERQLNALEKQIEELEYFVNSNVDWKLVGTYVDEGKTGTSVKFRKSYQELFKDLLTDKFSIIVIKDQSRLMRNVLEWYLFLDRAMKNEKKLFMYLDNQFYTPDNAFITGIKAMMAEEYSRDLSKRIKSAAVRAQKEGRVFGNGWMYGYIQRDAKLYVNEEQAAIVRDIYEMYSNGYGCHKIQEALLEKGITSINGTPFSFTTILKILGNEKYKGTYVGHKTVKDFETKTVKKTDESEHIVIEGIIPPIVSVELWEKCAKIRAGRKDIYKRFQKKTSNEYASYYSGKFAFSNRMVCGNCGEPMWHMFTKGNREGHNDNFEAPKGKRSSWLCRRYRQHGRRNSAGCYANRVYTSEMMDCVKHVIGIISEDSVSNEIDSVFEILQQTIKENSSEENLESYERELFALNKKVDKLLDMCLDGVIDKDMFNEKKQGLTVKIAELNKKISAIESGNRIVSEQETRLHEIKKSLDKIRNGDITVDEILVDSILKFMIMTEDEAGNHTAEIILDFNETPNVTYKSPRTKLFETEYPFQKYGCRYQTEMCKVTVSVF